MIKTTMTNAEFLENCRELKIDSPDVIGFYFPIPIPDFRGPKLYRDGTMEQPKLLSSCCFECADEFYFERTEEEVKEQWGYETEEDKYYIDSNREWYFATFPKDDLNSGVLITYTEANLEVFNYEFTCYLCETVSGY
jgi:hypothetical protein